MRNKYGKLFIEMEVNGDGNYQVKEEYKQPLFNYISGKQYKDVIIKLTDYFYLCSNSQGFSDDGGYIESYTCSYVDGSMDSFTAISIIVENNEISVRVNQM